MNEPYKTPLTEATDLSWHIRKLGEDPSNKELQKKVEVMSKEFIKYLNEYNKT
jgi:hypothetical protein